MYPRFGIYGGAFFLFFVSFIFLMTACSGKKAASEAEAEAMQEGQWLYTNNCAECHENSLPDLVKQPPNLHGLFNAKTLPSGAPATDEQVRKTILGGLRTMPAFDQRLGDDEVGDLIKYLHSLQ